MRREHPNRQGELGIGNSKGLPGLCDDFLVAILVSFCSMALEGSSCDNFSSLGYPCTKNMAGGWRLDATVRKTLCGRRETISIG
jgi:hypothetical protein